LKLLIVAAANNTHFLDDIVKALPVELEKRNFQDADVIWLEWADGDCLKLLLDSFYREKYLRKKKTILRIHRYELFNPSILNLIGKIDPMVIDHLVFVSHYVRQIGISHFPWMEKGVVIPNLIDVDKFPFNKDHLPMPGYDLLFLGRISYVKNLPLMLNMFNELLKIDSNYRLNLVGNIHEPELIYYLDNYIDKAKLTGKINIHGHIENELLPDFIKGMSYIVSSSIFESTGIGILEGMATGLRPVIFNFPGAEYLFPEQWLYIDRQKFVDIILRGGMQPKMCREFVLQNYSVQRKIGLYEELING